MQRNSHAILYTFVASLLVVVGISRAAYAITFGIPDVAGDDVEPVQSPAEIRVIDSAPRTLTLAWASDVRTITSDVSAAAGTQYDVTVYDKKTDERVYQETTTSTQVSVSGLERNHGYVVEVTTTRSGVTSNPVTIVARTTPAAPRRMTAEVVRRQILRDVITNEPVNQFGGSTMSDYLAYLSWKVPAGKVRYYTVQVYEEGSDEPVQVLRTKKHSIAIGDLETGVAYEAVVSAHFNDTYASPMTERIGFAIGPDEAAE